MAARFEFLVAIFLFLLPCLSQVFAADLCQWEYGRSILVNDTLFFMGGNYTFQGAGAQSVTEQQLYSLNLSTSFPVNGPLSDTFVHSTGSSQTQYVGGGAFFTDSERTLLYSMAGYPDASTSGINSMNSYDIQYDNWSGVSPGKEPLNKLNRGQAMYATTDSTDLGLGFIAGGMDWIPGMVTFNASDRNNPSWANATDNVPYFWGPATEYVRFGNKGVLVSVGGYTSYNNSEQRNMSAIQIYDIDSQHWFEVTATGDIPRTRSSFCSGLSSAPDDSSFQMTIYGGYNGQFGGNNGVGVIDDVYVLTMPAFRWIQIPTPANSGVNVTASRRHLCNMYRDRQMIVLGGDMVDAKGNPIGGCNAGYPPIKVLDTSTYTWQTRFPVVNGTYEVPAQVYDVIGGNSRGAASTIGPSGGFNTTIGNASASAIFSKRVTRSKASVTENSSGSPSDPGSIGKTPLPSATPVVSEHTSVVIGAVLGSLAFLFILGGLVYVLQARRARFQAQMNANWQKAELPDHSPSPLWAEKRPGGFKTYEMYGDDADALKPKELGTVVCSELEASAEKCAITMKSLPELPVEIDDS